MLKISNENLKKYKKVLKKNGWVLIKNVFSIEEIEQFRKDTLEYRDYYKKNGNIDSPGDLLSDNKLSSLVYNENILNIAKYLLNTNQLVYFGDSGAQIKSYDKRVSHGFHKDSASKDNQSSVDFNDNYPIIRIGVYLQDHKRHSEGLIVRNGSHKFADITSGKPVSVPNEIGDIVIWYLTTTHSGNAKRLKIFNDFSFGYDGTNNFLSLLWYRIPSFLSKPAHKDRMAIFLCYGANNNILKRYINYLTKRSYMLETWRSSNWKKDILKKINPNSLIIKDMPTKAKTVLKNEKGQGVFSLDS